MISKFITTIKKNRVATLLLIAGLILIIFIFLNYTKNSEPNKVQNPKAVTPPVTQNVEIVKTELLTGKNLPPAILPTEIITQLGKEKFVKRLIGNSKVYELNQQDILTNGVESYFESSGAPCNTYKCYIIENENYVLKVDENIAYISSFSIRSQDYWVAVWRDKDSFYLTISYPWFVNTNEIKFESAVKNITEVDSEQGKFDILYTNGNKEQIDLKTKI